MTEETVKYKTSLALYFWIWKILFINSNSNSNLSNIINLM